MKKTLNVILFFLTGISVSDNCSAMSSLFMEYLSEHNAKYTTEQLNDMTDIQKTVKDELLNEENKNHIAKEKAAEEERLKKEEEDRIAKEKAAEEKRLKQEEEDRIVKEKDAEEERLKQEEEDRIVKEKAAEEERLKQEEEDSIAKENAELLKNEEKLNALFDEASSILNESSFEKISDYHDRIGYAIEHYEDGGRGVLENFLKSLTAINSNDNNTLRYKFYGKVMLDMMKNIGERVDIFYKEKFNDVLLNIPVKVKATEKRGNNRNVEGEITIQSSVLFDNLDKLSEQTVLRKNLEKIFCMFGGKFLKDGKKHAEREYQIHKIDVNEVINKFKLNKNIEKSILSVQ